MQPPRAVVACASFKGTLSSREAGEAIARGLRAADWQADVVALADGGEGLVDALAAQTPGARKLSVTCNGPLGVPVEAVYALLPAEGGHVAVIEMAASSGLPLIAKESRDPKRATTFGVGEQIRSALGALEAASGRSEILLGIGGSATNDGGAGMAQALGARLLDVRGQELERGGAALANLARIDISGVDARLRNVRVTVACDVHNPLCGPEGASAVYGPQKGATPQDVQVLDAALAHYASIVRRDLGMDVSRVPGAGAAGGLGAGCLAFLNATLKPGIELVLDALHFDKVLEGAALAITGEGKLDEQTLMGKAPAGVASRVAKKGIRCVAIGGGIDPVQESALRQVFARLESLSAFAGSVDAAMREPARYLEALSRSRVGEWLS